MARFSFPGSVFRTAIPLAGTFGILLWHSIRYYDSLFQERRNQSRARGQSVEQSDSPLLNRSYKGVSIEESIREFR